jgi:hypothetical protein
MDHILLGKRNHGLVLGSINRYPRKYETYLLHRIRFLEEVQLHYQRPQKNKSEVHETCRGLKMPLFLV